MAITPILLVIVTTINIGQSLATLPMNQTIEIVFDGTASESDTRLLDPDRVLSVIPPDPPSCFPSFVSAAVRSLHQEAFEKIFNLLLNDGVFFNSNRRRAESPYNYQCPTCLESCIDFKIREKGENHSNLMEYLHTVLKYSPRVSHPFYLAKSGSGLDPYALAADWLGSTVSSIPTNYCFGPVYTLMEISVIQNLRRLIGYQDGDYPGGTVTPGNSVANIMAVHLALQNKFPNFKQNGFIGGKLPKMAVFISAGASGSFEKAQIFGGLARGSLVRINVDRKMRMCARTLEAEIQKSLQNGVIPAMVVATAGTPTVGAIDSIFEIAQICQKYNIWLHVDGDRAGACIFSGKQKIRLSGIELSDSVTWSASRILGAPHLSTFLLTKDSAACRNAFTFGAPSVYPKSDLYNSSYDMGDQTIQTTRRPEVIKTWFMWKAKGRTGIADHLDKTYENLEFFTTELKNLNRNGSFQLFLDSFDTPMASFLYLPLDMRHQENQSKEFVRDMNTFTLKLKKTLLTSGVMQISVSSCRTQPLYFFTLSLYNSALTKSDLLHILDQIIFFGEQVKIYSLSESKTILPVPNAPTSYPLFVSAPLESEHKDFYVKLFQLFLKKGLFFQDSRRDPPLRFRRPEILQTLMDFDLGDDGLSQVKLLREAEKVIQYTPHYGHPAYLLQLKSGLDPYSVMSDYVGSAINSPMQTYEDSPAFTLMEREVLLEVRKLVGYPNGNGDGVINDGGSLSNMMAMALARYKKFSGTNEGGNVATERQMVVYVSEEAHYSFQKAAFMQGHGLENCVAVQTDFNGRMLVSELRKAVQTSLSEGKLPFMVGATAGTTVLGAIDPLDEIADICKEFGLWFHVDGVFGGAIIMSDKYRSRLKGVERSDSFAINFHKLFAGSSTMAVLVTRHPEIHSKALGISERTDFSTPDDGSYNRQEYDIGDKQIQDTKRANILKIWFLWKAKGTAGLGSHVEYMFDRANTLKMEIRSYGPAYELVIPEFELTNVCFYYIPKRLRGVKKNRAYFDELDQVAPTLNKILGELGLMNIVAQTRKPGDTTFLKMPLMNSGISDEDVKYFVKLIDFYGKDL